MAFSFNKFKKIKSDPLFNLFVSEKKRTLILTSFIILPSFIASLLEGLSYAFIFLALSSLGGHNILEVRQLSFIANSPLGQFFGELSVKKQFVTLIFCSITFQGLKSALNYIGKSATTLLSTRIQKRAQDRIFGQIFSFSFPSISRYKSGDLFDYVQVSLTVTSITFNALNEIIVSFLASAVIACIMFYLSFPLTLAAFFLMVCIGICHHFILKKIIIFSKSLTDKTVAFNKTSAQFLQSFRPIHTFSRQKEVLKKLQAHHDEICTSTNKLGAYNHLLSPLHELLGMGLLGTLIVIGCIFLNNRSFPLMSGLLTFAALTYRLISRIQLFVTNIGIISSQMGPLSRLRTFLKTNDKEFICDQGQLVKALSKQIVFDQISLQYPSSSSFALKDISFSLPVGTTLALVGPSGAGKSSLIDLLVRLYEPTAGQILVDGRCIKSLKLSDWRSQLGVVSQDSFIFNDTISENIRFGKLDATSDEIIAASRMAGAHEFIESLPQRYETSLGERGYRLSGGQCQRIALARALVRNPSILILDEATSNLDSYSETLIQEALTKFRKNKTVIMIAHRLSTIIDADQILVLENGSLVEHGTHEELLELQEGVYHSLWNLQSRDKNSSGSIEKQLI